MYQDRPTAGSGSFGGECDYHSKGQAHAAGELAVMPKVLLLQFHSDPESVAHRAMLSGLGAKLVEDEPRWPTFFDTLNRERPDVVVISLGKIPSHGREAARYIKDGFNTRNMPVILTDVPAKDI